MFKKLEQFKQKKAIEKERASYHKKVIKEENKRKKEYHEPSSEAFLVLKNINKIYDNHVQAVYDFNLAVNKNEFIVFVGPSGCGKSTTLRMIAGLEDITSGDLFINGEYVNYVSPKDRDIAMVFQSYALYPHMSVYDNMAFGLKIRHVKKEIIDERVKEAARILELSDYLDRKPRALSGGQCQRVALGRAIVRNASLFLMDEPLSNLDAKLRVQMRSEIVALHQALNATTIYVTHDQTEAMTMASRIVVMKDGYVQQIGTPIEIYDHPANTFVATFVGSPSMNIIDVELSKDTIIISNDLKIKLTKEQQSLVLNNYKKYLDSYLNKLNDKKSQMANIGTPDHKKDSLTKDIAELEKRIVICNDYINGTSIKVRLGIRAEDIVQYDNSLEKSKYSKPFNIVVKVAELLGHEYFVHFKHDNHELVSKVSLTNDLIKANDTLKLAINLANIHLFDCETSESLLK